MIVYDPWWTPTTESRAIDQACRIGPDKPVFMHQLIVKNTVDAAIRRMQEHKLALAVGGSRWAKHKRTRTRRKGADLLGPIVSVNSHNDVPLVNF